MAKNTRRREKAASKKESSESRYRRQVRDISNITLVASIMIMYLAAITIAIIAVA